MTHRDSVLAAVVASIWGFNFIVIDWGMKGVPPLLFLAIRFLFVLFPAILFVPRPKVSWRVLAMVGTFMSLGHFGFLYLSLTAGMPPGLAALVLQTQVFFTIGIAAVALRERPHRVQVLGVLLALVGLTIVGFARGGTLPLGALALCLLGALSWGVGNVVSRSSGARSGLSLTVWSSPVVPLPALVLALAIDGPNEVLLGLQAFGWKAAVSSLYTAGMASLVGYGVFNSLLSRNSAAAVVPWVLIAPIIAIVAAATLLSQIPGPEEICGAAVMVIGLLIALRGARPSQQGAHVTLVERPPPAIR